MAATFSVASEKLMVTFIGKIEGTKVTKTVLNEKNKVRMTFPKVKASYIVTVVKTV